MASQKTKHKTDYAKLFFLFVLTYLIIYFLGVFRFTANWNFTGNIFQWDYMFVLMPVAGFFFLYFSFNWIEEYYETKLLRTPLFPILLFVLGGAGFYIAVYWYLANAYALQGDPGPIVFDFWDLFINSAYLTFLLGMLGGWLSYLVVEKTSKK